MIFSILVQNSFRNPKCCKVGQKSKGDIWIEKKDN
jgi:hypothetical protein